MSELTTMSQRKTKKEAPPTMSLLKKTIFGIVATMALVFGVATGAYASLPIGTTVTGALKSGTAMTFKGDIDSIPITVSCTGFSASGKVTKATDTLPLSAPPSITGCTDSSGGTDTVTTSGAWKITIAATKMTLDAPQGRSHLQVEHPFRLHHHRLSQCGRQGSGQLQRLEHGQSDGRLNPHQWLWVHQHHGQNDGHGETEPGSRRASLVGRRGFGTVPPEQMGLPRVNPTVGGRCEEHRPPAAGAEGTGRVQ